MREIANRNLLYDNGDYYAWGEIETYYSAGGNTEEPTWKDGYSAGYDWSTYKYMDHSIDSWEGFTKYTFADGQTEGIWYDSEGQFIGDNKTELEDADDVAVQTWGGAWKMPTYEQQTELRDECYWVWTDTYNGVSVNGYIVYKAKKDEDKGVKVYDYNTPSSDYDVATDAHIFLPAAGYRWGTDLINVGGSYLSRSLGADDSDYARDLYFDSYRVDWDYYYRLYGFSVRPVYKAPIAEITTNEGTKVYTDVKEFKLGFSDIEGEATVKLLGDIVLQDVDFDNDNEDANITLDLNGHSITDNNDDGIIIIISRGALTITGEGTIENTAEYGITILSAGTLTVKGGTYKSVLAACGVAKGSELIIDGGQFDSEALYYTSEYYTKPIVKGGIFSMDPSDCVADGYEAVANDDEATKADYPYKVVSLEARLAAYMGDTEYVNTENPEDYYFVNEQGQICRQVFGGFGEECMIMSNSYTLSFSEGNFVYSRPDVPKIIFYVDNDAEEVTRIAVVYEDDIIYEYLPVSKIPTAVESINADKAQKAIKTVENGKVVIIRNGEKFDLAGRKL